MLKKLSTIALMGFLALPGTIQAASTTDLSSKIDQLTKELSQLRDQMEEQEEAFEEMDERAEGWDLASRFQITGDIRSRLDIHQGETGDAFTMAGAVGGAYVNGGMLNTPGTQAFTPDLMNYMGGMQAGAIAVPVTESEDWEDDTFFTTRLRMNMRVKATENIEVKARVVGYKAWGMQSNPAAPGISTPYYQNSMTYDGTVARMPSDSNLKLDRAFMNWNNIGGAPVWFSIGRRPTTDGPPNHLRMGLDKRMATPSAYMDYPFDGISMGYAYANLFGISDVPGRIRFCAGRGYEDGIAAEDSGINDTDFAGLSWDIMKKGNRFAYLQSFAAINIFNVPGDNTMTNPAMANFLDMQSWMATGAGLSAADFEDVKTLDRQIMGDIYHTTAVYMDKISSLNYFGTFGWSMTDSSGDMDEWGQALGGDTENNKHGYAVLVGGRYDLEDLGLKLGAEYNWGSENWLAFSPGHDDMYVSKLQTRGSVYELYMIYDLPSGEAISKYGKAFMRIGYQHYDYDYTGSGNWMSNPIDISDATDMANMQGVAPLESVDNIYITMEAYF